MPGPMGPLARAIGLLAVFALVVSACGGEYPQSSIDPHSDFAETIHGLYWIVFVWSMVILAVVWALLAYVLIRFRDRPGAERPKQTHGNLRLEIAWTLGPALIVVAIAVPTIRAVFETQPSDPEGAMVVEVIGHQFWWEFRYPEAGVVTANELRLPVGRPVSLRLSSADVIHSFWVPMLGGKRDANPLVRKPEGEPPDYNWLHFTVREPGEYMGQCAEFCGPSHSLMGTRVVAESPEEFDAWLESWQSSAPTEDPPDAASLPEGLDPILVQQGREIFHSQTCVACHAIQGTNAQGQVAPNLTLMGQRTKIAAGWLDNSVEDLERWIRAPRDVKPGALMPGVGEAGGNWPATGLTDEQVRAVAQYLSSLR